MCRRAQDKVVHTHHLLPEWRYVYIHTGKEWSSIVDKHTSSSSCSGSESDLSCCAGSVMNSLKFFPSEALWSILQLCRSCLLLMSWHQSLDQRSSVLESNVSLQLVARHSLIHLLTMLVYSPLSPTQLKQLQEGYKYTTQRKPTMHLSNAATRGGTNIILW